MGSLFSLLNPSNNTENNKPEEKDKNLLTLENGSFSRKKSSSLKPNNSSKEKMDIKRRNTSAKDLSLEKDSFHILRIDTLLERIDRQKKMSPEEIEKEEQEYKNLTKESLGNLVVLEKCSFCKDKSGDVEINSCNHPLCQECFGISQLEGNHCMVEGCEKIYSQVKNLKTGQILNLE